MKKIMILMTIGMLIILSGCRAEHHHGHGYNSYDDDYEYHAVYNDPDITYFEVYDSYGDSSQYFPEIALNPYIDDGWFQINWSVDTYDDYIVEYRINDHWSEYGSVLIDSEYCGNGLSCDQDGVQFCQYFPDLTVSCDADTRTSVSISHMVSQLPEQLYLIIQVCSTDYFECDYTYTSVFME